MTANPIYFPSDIRPSGRTYTPGVVPKTVFESQNGVQTTLQFGNLTSKSKLQLKYTNISEANALALTELYFTWARASKAYIAFKQNNASVDDMKSKLQNYIRGKEENLRYHFENPPTVQALLANRYNVTIDLVGVLEFNS